MTKTQPTPASHSTRSGNSQQTLLDHLHELRTRLFWVILALIVAGTVGYALQNQIIAVIMRPLGGQQLVYLTPIGGFNFIFKISLYFGIGLIVPVIIYHVYRFLEPLMERRRKRSVLFYILASTLLALAGAGFAYFASLPAALHFLTGFNIEHVTAMLTVDSYLAFVITYVLGFAALFQIPLILMIINTVRPIPPKSLLGFQRFVVLIAFILAAVISPTPDITNQTILAIPIILMYQIGVLLVWWQTASARRRAKRTLPANAPAMQSLSPQPLVAPSPSAAIHSIHPQTPQAGGRRVMDIANQPRRSVAVRSMPRSMPASRPTPIMTRAERPSSATNSQLPPRRPTSIDGIVPRQVQQAS